VCVGNACRSQMAEGFARAYGSDVLVPASAGVAPALFLSSTTLKAMEEKGIDLRDHFPKSTRHVSRIHFDLVVNMSGVDLPSKLGTRIEDWDVPDPVSMTYEDHCEIRDRIETMVMQLILALRGERDRAG
jgi:arsenate reductase (thioredoxin)